MSTTMMTTPSTSPTSATTSENSNIQKAHLFSTSLSFDKPQTELYLTGYSNDEKEDKLKSRSVKSKDLIAVLEKHSSTLVDLVLGGFNILDAEELFLPFLCCCSNLQKILFYDVELVPSQTSCEKLWILKPNLKSKLKHLYLIDSTMRFSIFQAWMKWVKQSNVTLRLEMMNLTFLESCFFKPPKQVPKLTSFYEDDKLYLPSHVNFSREELKESPSLDPIYKNLLKTLLVIDKHTNKKLPPPPPPRHKRKNNQKQKKPVLAPLPKIDEHVENKT
jgi:hypothetical protein